MPSDIDDIPANLKRESLADFFVIYLTSYLVIKLGVVDTAELDVELTIFGDIYGEDFSS